MSQQCEALTNKNNVVKQLSWHVFTGEKAPRQGIPKPIVYSTGQLAFGIWSESLKYTRLRTTREARCLHAMSYRNTKLEIFGLHEMILAQGSI